MSSEYKPIILIGAARSGTKLLRDLIGVHPQVDRVPYDVTYFWTKYNEALGHDELLPEHATEKVRAYVRRALGRFHEEAPFLIEKTVNNCVRIPFVHAVFPDAKFIVLRRDGIDVVESVYRQWTAPPDPGYILKKLRTFPIMDAFGYGMRYAKTQFAKVVLKKFDAGVWGVRYKGVEEDLKRYSLLEVCAIQWKVCVEQSEDAMLAIPDAQKAFVRYEELVQNPSEVVRSICEFVGVPYEPTFTDEVLNGMVQRGSVGKGAKNLKPDELASVAAIITPAMERLGYTLPPA